jgi:hypothetical protein
MLLLFFILANVKWFPCHHGHGTALGCGWKRKHQGMLESCEYIE